MSDLYSVAEGPQTYFSVAARAVGEIPAEQAEQIPLFFEAAFNKIPLPKAPLITARGSGGSLYAELTVDAESEIESVELYVAHSQTISAYRNWHSQAKEKIGPDEYLSRISVYSAELPVYAFANVLYKSGVNISGEVISVIPSSMGLTAAPFTKKRLIYDQSSGTTEWIGKNLSVMPGPFSILGITGGDNRLSTFILADERYKGGRDLSLQLTVYSFKEQSIKFSVISSEGFTRYECDKPVSPGDNWQKIALSCSDFRSPSGIFEDWAEAVIFEIAGDSAFLINSMLWI
jgi:hypothetical protein